MGRYRKEKKLPGTKSPVVREYEIRHRSVAGKIAQEGIVLLKNEGGILPVSKDKVIALYGAGASKTIKGGTGSGDVNERESVTIWQGLKNAGYRIVNEAWLHAYDAMYEKSREKWREAILKEVEDRADENNRNLFFEVYCDHPYRMPEGELPEKAEGDLAFYVLSRIAGEGSDRRPQKGDYYLSEEEEQMLERICQLYSDVVLLMNVGSVVDLSFLDRYEQIRGILLLSQPGMEGGNAAADIISGKVSPSGKLTDTWAVKYEQYPNYGQFSFTKRESAKEYYREGIYVGYRYFDTFQVSERYSFGYGLSYTEFEITTEKIYGFAMNREDARIILSGKVKNTGERFSGKEVVQIYASCPWGELKKEYRRLVGFYKTKELAPGEEERFELEIPVYDLASYSENRAGWILEKGYYGLFVGNGLETAEFAGSVLVETDHMLIKTEAICPLREELEMMEPALEDIRERRDAWMGLAKEYPLVTIRKEDLVERIVSYGVADQKLSSEALKFADSLNEDQLISLATGDLGKASENTENEPGVFTPGEAGESSGCALENGLATIALADGPAGLRLQREYCVKEDVIQKVSLEGKLEGGYFLKDEKKPVGEVFYQFCTAFPIGTMLAQTWNQALLVEMGKAVGEEMEEFGITLWLAPGMNIHRNPLCGRNFEYYSEDPYLSGKMAVAVTKGVQSVYGVGTTIKHFACNNREDDRMESDSIVSERTLREIYLKGFEIAVKQSQPFAIMTSYNMLNGARTSNSYDLCTKTAREEWDFHGLIMTDWMTTGTENCTAAGCIRAGNDLIMPGMRTDHENLKEELEKGTLLVEDLKKCVSRLTDLIWRSNHMEVKTGSPAVDEIRRNFYLGDRIRDAGLTDPAGIETAENISYGPHGIWNLLDVYKGKDAVGKQPVIVSMHGGGWSYGDKELYRYYCMDLAMRGFAVINYNYRLSPEAHFPSNMEDANAVFVWLADHADEYGLDSGNVFVVGDSAGAQMASQYLTILTNPDYRKEFELDVPVERITVRGVALNCGIYEMKEAVDTGVEALFEEYLGEALWKDREATLRKTDACRFLTKDFPPAYVMTASHDFLRDAALPMAELLASKGAEVEYHLYGTEEQNYMGHVFHCKIRLKEAILCNDDECDFFKNRVVRD